ncbi:MAG: GNAT family N-acetyltransferase [Trueperaceae bacterium]|nr:GNAT family N-acetyltransferase [Trueperaceae bacterium]
MPKLEVGYWLRSGYTGSGLMSEAVRALSRAAVEGLEPARLEIRVDDRNVRSAHVAERCGYRLEGTLEHDGRDPREDLRSTRIYALTAPLL